MVLLAGASQYPRHPETRDSDFPLKVTPFSFHGRASPREVLPSTTPGFPFFPRVAFNSLSRRRAIRKFLHSLRRKNKHVPPRIEGGKKKNGGATPRESRGVEASKEVRKRSFARVALEIMRRLFASSITPPPPPPPPLTPVLVILRVVFLFSCSAPWPKSHLVLCRALFSRASKSRRAGTRAEVNANVLKTYCDIIYSHEPRKRGRGKGRKGNAYNSNSVS